MIYRKNSRLTEAEKKLINIIKEFHSTTKKALDQDNQEGPQISKNRLIAENGVYMDQYQNPYYMVPQRRPRAWVNGTLIVLNILYFLYLELTGSTEDAYFMLDHGAMYGPFILENHEYYRLLTSIFMHFGIDHIVNNMLVLFVLGDNLERALGKVKYLIFT